MVVADKMFRLCGNSTVIHIAWQCSICVIGFCLFTPNCRAAEDTAGSATLEYLVEVSDGLRSAYLHRVDPQREEVPVPQLSSDDQQEQLRRHFDVVLELLVANTDNSLQIALDRLQHARGQHWTDDQRARWRETLAANRAAQLQRLAAYRDRGLFPRNEGHAPYTVPIFVDHHDTACAVGHLMRMSDCEESVNRIADSNNLVYVPDVDAGPLIEWVLTSGLTQEEAALIQPSYDHGGFGKPIKLPVDYPYPPERFPLPPEGISFPPVECPVDPPPQRLIPEPSSIVVLTIAMLAFASAGRHRRREEIGTRSV